MNNFSVYIHTRNVVEWRVQWDGISLGADKLSAIIHPKLSRPNITSL